MEKITKVNFVVRQAWIHQNKGEGETSPDIHVSNVDADDVIKLLVTGSRS